MRRVPGLRLPFGPPALISRIQAKRFQYEAAERAGVGLPTTAYPRCEDEAREAAASMPYPAVMKPSLGSGFKQRYGRPLIEADTPEQLVEAYRAGAEFEPMFQERIPGGDDALWTVGSYVDARGRALGMFCGRKLLQAPAGVGTCRVGEAVWDDDAVDGALRLLSELGFHGISQVEYKRDARDGSLRLMEVNARLWQWHSLAADCGVDLVGIAYRDTHRRLGRSRAGDQPRRRPPPLGGAGPPPAREPPRPAGSAGDACARFARPSRSRCCRCAIRCRACTRSTARFGGRGHEREGGLGAGDALLRPVTATRRRRSIRPGSLPRSEAAWRYFERGEAAPPVLRSDGLLDFGDGIDDLVASAFWHLSRWEERPGSPRDRHGRFAGTSSLADPERPAVDALLERFREATGFDRRPGFTIVLTHDIDTPRRWTSSRSVVAAGARMKGALFSRDREPAVQRGGRAGAAAAGRASRQRPELVVRAHARDRGGPRRPLHPLRDGRAPSPAGRRRRRLRSRAHRLVDLVRAQGDEVGLHPSYTTSDHPNRLADEKSRLESAVGAPVRSVRFHFLRHDPHTSLAQLDQLGFALDSQRRLRRPPGLRAGFSFPYRPYDLAADRPLRAGRAAAGGDGRDAG